MSYVWSSPATVTIQEPSASKVTSVTITSVSPNPAKVNEIVNISARADLDGAAVGVGDCVEFALAVGSTSNIVKVYSVSLSAGAKSASVTFQTTFSQAGTYTVYVGARYMVTCTGTPR